MHVFRCDVFAYLNILKRRRIIEKDAHILESLLNRARVVCARKKVCH